MLNALFSLIGMILSYAGKNAIDLIVLAVVSYGGWKLFTNHLAHMKKDIELVKKTTSCMDSKVKKIKTIVFNIKKDLAVRTAICEERHKDKSCRK